MAVLALMLLLVVTAIDEGCSPVEFMHFNNGGKDKKVKEIAVANSWRNVVDDSGLPCRPQSMPAFGSRGSTMATATSSSSFASRDGASFSFAFSLSLPYHNGLSAFGDRDEIFSPKE